MRASEIAAELLKVPDAEVKIKKLNGDVFEWAEVVGITVIDEIIYPRTVTFVVPT